MQLTRPCDDGMRVKLLRLLGKPLKSTTHCFRNSECPGYSLNITCEFNTLVNIIDCLNLNEHAFGCFAHVLDISDPSDRGANKSN